VDNPKNNCYYFFVVLCICTLQFLNLNLFGIIYKISHYSKFEPQGHQVRLNFSCLATLFTCLMLNGDKFVIMTLYRMFISFVLVSSPAIYYSFWYQTMKKMIYQQHFWSNNWIMCNAILQSLKNHFISLKSPPMFMVSCYSCKASLRHTHAILGYIWLSKSFSCILQPVRKNRTL